jgi:60 kDa SS-A/Ro ribonucleoprotein
MQLEFLLKTIRHFRLTREQVPTEALALLPVQLALLTNEDHTKITMPMTALLRNLANLTRLNLFEESNIRNLVITHLKNAEVIDKSRVHPVHVLTAWFTYRKGHGKMSKHTWTPNQEIVKVLQEMFYLSFKNVRPTGKRLCFLIDCSGSMGSDSLCEGVTNAEAAALLAMVFSRAEANASNPVSHSFYLFTSGRGNEGLMDVSDLIHAKATFENILTAVQRSDWATTDISKGIVQAMKFRRLYDGFVVLTDNDVNSGIKPSVALQQYRKALNIPAKLVVVATQASDISIADPEDKGMMDFCGFDSHGPKILQEFFSGPIVEPLLEADIDE